MKTRLALSVLLLGLFVSLGALADPLPTTPPESVGLSSKRLQVITDTLKADIAKGAIPGAVLLISRHGKVAYFEAMGSLDPDKKTPMTQGCDLPHLFHDQADHHGRRHDAVRAGQAGARPIRSPNTSRPSRT